MSLLTLPRFSATAAQSLALTAALACLQPTPAQRGRVALQAIRAVKRGTLAASEALRAARDGDAGLAALLGRHANTPQRPELRPESFALQAFDRAPGRHVRQPLADLMRVLAQDGDLTTEDSHAIAGPAGTFGTLVRRVNAAWNRRCDRLTAPVRALLPADVPLRSSYLVMPGALMAVLQPGIYTHQPYESIREADEPPDAQVFATGQLVVTEPASHKEPEARAALAAAWNALSAAIDSPFMESAQNGLATLVGYADELLSDAALGVEWQDDEPLISDRQLQELADEIGLDASSPDRLMEMRDYLRYAKATAKAPRWKPRSVAMRSWLSSNDGTPVGQAVTVLRKLTALAARGPHPDRDAITREYSDEGLLPVCVLPIDTGLDGYFEFVIDQNFQNCGEAEVQIILDKGKGASLGDLLDRLVLDAAIVAAAASVVAHATPRPDPEPEEELSLDFGDDDD